MVLPSENPSLLFPLLLLQHHSSTCLHCLISLSTDISERKVLRTPWQLFTLFSCFQWFDCLLAQPSGKKKRSRVLIHPKGPHHFHSWWSERNRQLFLGKKKYKHFFTHHFPHF